MQQLSAIDQIENAILQVVLENSNSTSILSDLAIRVGNLFAAEICLIISPNSDTFKINQIDYWEHQTKLISGETLGRLSHIPLNTFLPVPSPLIEPGSDLFEAITPILQNILSATTWLGMTTQSQDQINGLILLGKTDASPWNQAEQELLSKNSHLIAIAISQAKLQQQALTKTKHQNLFHNLSQEISRGYQPQLLFHNCLKEVSTALQIDQSMILLLKYQNPLRAKDRNKHFVKGTAKIAYQWNSAQDFVSQSELSFSLNSSNLCQQAWRNAPHCLNFAVDAPFPDLTANEIPPQGTALLMMPLMGKKTSENDSPMVLGFLVLQQNSVRYWSKDELDLVAWVAVQISTAMIHDQTLNQVQLIVDERTAQLKSSLDVQAKLSAKMRQHIKQLQKVNQLKDDFMNSMSHELKTPLTSMKIAIKMLRQAQISPEMRERYLDILEQEWNREYNLIKDLLTLQQVESGELDYSPQELNLKQTIEHLTQVFREKWQEEREISFVSKITEADLKIHTDAESLEHILNELLSNASKYCDPQTTIELLVSSQINSGKEEIVISVANMGAGITPEELPHIFDKFRRGKGVTDRAVPGTGLGLTLVQYLVEHLNGTIDVTSEPLDDHSQTFLTTFVLRLPQIQPVIS